MRNISSVFSSHLDSSSIIDLVISYMRSRVSV